ncbi:DNA methylase N-4/N-6 domain-containing protein [Mycobacteroides abscessus subsp. massiliense]|nr:DNA methylase N-4/N-6 domain-containing protein [Mycobacteroides abscessus subsp. massiliense]
MDEINRRSADDIALIIDEFQRALPYRERPYSSRAWGHKLHSLCSYQGKMKPSIAHWLVRSFTDPGDLVVDPLAGVGTIPLEAALLGRRSIANDLSPLAATVAGAKINPPSLDEALGALEKIECAIGEAHLTDNDIESASFGLNASVRDYYHEDTLHEILCARQVFTNGSLRDSASDFVWASMLHVLHGNRPYALSRTSHPITPFSPKGPFVYKSVIDKTRTRIQRALAYPLPEDFISGTVFEGSFVDLPTNVQSGAAAAIITSPPFLGMRFDRPNWLRLWFCGWSAEDFHTTSLKFLERQQTRSLDPYQALIDTSDHLLRRGGLFIVHIGSSRTDRLVDGIRAVAQSKFRLVGEVTESVTELENHGLPDKGNRTDQHHLLFFQAI